jgi:hypothetical protein
MKDVEDQAAKTEQLADTMLEQVFALLGRHNIIPNDVPLLPPGCQAC